MPGSTENAALLFLLITSSLLPILYECYLQQEEKKRNNSIEESIVSVAEMTLRVRRQLDTPGNQDEEGGRRKRRRSSRFKHERAERAIHEDYILVFSFLLSKATYSNQKTQKYPEES